MYNLRLASCLAMIINFGRWGNSGDIGNLTGCVGTAGDVELVLWGEVRLRVRLGLDSGHGYNAFGLDRVLSSQTKESVGY